MTSHEYFTFFCSCGKELRTGKDRKAYCARCDKHYQVEMMPQKCLIPEKEKQK